MIYVFRYDSNTAIGIYPGSPALSVRARTISISSSGPPYPKATSLVIHVGTGSPTASIPISDTASGTNIPDAVTYVNDGRLYIAHRYSSTALRVVRFFFNGSALTSKAWDIPFASTAVNSLIMPGMAYIAPNKIVLARYDGNSVYTSVHTLHENETVSHSGVNSINLGGPPHFSSFYRVQGSHYSPPNITEARMLTTTSLSSPTRQESRLVLIDGNNNLNLSPVFEVLLNTGHAGFIEPINIYNAQGDLFLRANFTNSDLTGNGYFFADTQCFRYTNGTFTNIGAVVSPNAQKDSIHQIEDSKIAHFKVKDFLDANTARLGLEVYERDGSLTYSRNMDELYTTESEYVPNIHGLAVLNRDLLAGGIARISTGLYYPGVFGTYIET